MLRALPRSGVICAAFAAALLAGCGSDPSQPGPFRAHRLAVLADGAVAVAGVNGHCGELSLRRVGRDERGEPVGAEGLGGQCVDAVERVTVTPRGVDVLAEVKRDEGGPFESDVLTPKGLARFHPDGELDEDFGDDGMLERVQGSIVTRPDGSLASPTSRFSPSGEIVAEPTPPVRFVDDEVLAAAPGHKLTMAGEPSGAASSGRAVLVRLTPGDRLDPRFGSSGAVEFAESSPVDLKVLRGGETLTLFFSGALVKLDREGRPARSFGRAGTASLFGRALPGATPRMAIGPRGEIAVMRVRDGRAQIVRVGTAGTALSSFRPEPLPAREGADLAFDRAGRLLVLTDGERLVALDARGRRVPPLGGGTLTVPAR